MSDCQILCINDLMISSTLSRAATVIRVHRARLPLPIPTTAQAWMWFKASTPLRDLAAGLRRGDPEMIDAAADMLESMSRHELTDEDIKALSRRRTNL